jgi:hypothetical protein
MKFATPIPAEPKAFIAEALRRTITEG